MSLDRDVEIVIFASCHLKITEACLPLVPFQYGRVAIAHKSEVIGPLTQSMTGFAIEIRTSGERM